MSGKLKLCVDFDGVIHVYTSKWVDAQTISDGPVDGAFEWLDQMVKDFEVNIYSSRSKEEEGVKAMKKWFWKHGLSEETLALLQFPTQKPGAFLTIDDRCWLFKGPGTFPTKEQIRGFVAWNKEAK